MLCFLAEITYYLEPNAKRKMNLGDYTKCFLKFDDETMMKVPKRTIYYQVSLRFAILERSGFGFCHKTLVNTQDHSRRL